jgi:hypothetical protein
MDPYLRLPLRVLIRYRGLVACMAFPETILECFVEGVPGYGSMILKPFEYKEFNPYAN